MLLQYHAPPNECCVVCYSSVSSSLLPEETDHAYCLVVSDEVSESSVSESSVSSLDDALEYSGEDGDFTQLDS